ncbi:hypothetical protein LR48_Vigan04g127600 [Vigna angularis]|uniref:Aminotransferase-like plant mobile domain-containing protein n=1 Tax=Phaseolus angularis TaxID=3914 RepID=A0A0L9UEB6_PHAAN|nr:hypothetical protein LR48_Vigan04g127600 [Vigna angularis]
MASSSSRRGKKVAHLLRNASPNGWISDDEERYKFGCYRKLFKVFYHNLEVVDGVICSRVKGVDIKIDDEIWLSFTGLKAEGFMSHERNFELNQWTNKKKIYKEYLRSPTRLKVYKPYLLDGLKMEEKMCAFVLTWVILAGRCLCDRLTTADLFLVHAIKARIPTNWVAVMSEHMIEIASSHGHILPYGVFINRVLKHHQVDLIGEKKF